MSDSEFIKIFSKRLRYYLDYYNISQADLARRLGVGTTSVSNWVNGIKTPRMSKVDMMCEIFHCKRSDLMEEKEAEPEGYYVDPRTAEIAQEIKDSHELSALFDVQRDLPPEDLQAVYQMVLALKRKEADRGN